MNALHQIFTSEAATAPSGALSFARVMELALYHPDHGYYGAGPRALGRAGDFFTSVSVGPLYGRLLAGLAAGLWEKLGRPADFHIIEQGAHDGQLAQDMLDACEFPVILVEANARHREAQMQRLTSYGGRVSWVESLAALPPCAALHVSNELPDAMPVHVVRREGGLWLERCVAWENDGPVWKSLPPMDERLCEELKRLPELPEGHVCEIQLATLEWMRALAGAAFHGEIVIADYGLDAEELNEPQRVHGTLRRYFQHQMDDRVLESLGECDLTSHVNFTRLLETAEAEGLRVLAYEPQGRFLSRCGLDWVKSLDGRLPNAATRALLRQFHTLTHPAFLGRSFRIVHLEKLPRLTPA